MLEQKGHNGPPQDQQPGHGREKQGRPKANALGQGGGKARIGTSEGLAGKPGQSGRGHGHRQHPHRKLKQTHGVLEHGHGTIRKEGGQPVINKQVHLGHCKPPEHRKEPAPHLLELS